MCEVLRYNSTGEGRSQDLRYNTTGEGKSEDLRYNSTVVAQDFSPAVWNANAR